MRINHLHYWNLDPKRAIALQHELASDLISDVPLALDEITSVAGVDVSIRGKHSRAAVVVMSVPGLDVLEVVRAEREVSFPYIPGLLAFREGPVVVDALRQLGRAPDAFIFDGMGQIHPRKLGIAAHLGLWLGQPTIGCGKTHYIGEYIEPAAEKGSKSFINCREQRIGAVLRTRAKVKPVYISVGHLADLESALKLAMLVTTRFRLPEPVRAAHHAARL